MWLCNYDLTIDIIIIIVKINNKRIFEFTWQLLGNIEV